ncbi:MAG TPA: hypothetical protein VFI12_03185 [Thermomicrobiales bacterium]|nr:hypothetical protein [Thermomicrobiales bacterium]
MTDTPLIEVNGKPPAGAACAAILARAGVRLRVFGVDETFGGLALVSRSILEELGIAGAVTAYPIDRVTERVLSEDSATDTTAPIDDLVAVQTPEIAAALLAAAETGAASPAGDAVLRVDATEFRLGDLELQDDDFLPISALEQVVQLEWTGGRPQETIWIRMTGDPLGDVRAHAALVVTPDRSALGLAVPTEALVQASITLPDVLHRLLAQPRVAAEIPADEPVTTSTRLLKTNGAVHLSLNGDLRVRVGAAAGLAGPLVLDRELRSGMNAGLAIAAALSEGRLSLARLSRLARP